jgi:uncharacterized protein YjbJ (UPF0337 family)
MNKDQIKGGFDDAAGRVKRKIGEWTGDTEAEVEGTAQQVKGKAEKAAGNVRDAVNNARRDRDMESNLDVDDDREDVREQDHFHDRE